MVKKIPLFVIPNSLVWSAIKVKITPEEKETNSITKKAGNTRGSKTSTQPILNNLKENGCFWAFGNVSFIFSKIRMDIKAKAEEVKNIMFIVKLLAK